MQSPEESTRAAELLELLLTDADFRARFRKSPAQACEDFDLPDLAREFGAGGKSLHTLEIRESRSSLAGAFMAAASEGAGGLSGLRQLHESNQLSGDAHRVVDHALTSPKLQAVGHHPLADASGGSAHEVVDSWHVPSAPDPVHVHEPSGAAELLANPNLTLSPDAHAALLAGGADHRLVSVLEELTKSHRIQIGSLQTGGGGSLDILAVDGHRVEASNIAARDLADELSSLGPGQRPAQVVTPWPIAGTGFSTGSGHDDRIHIVFGEPGHAPPSPTDASAAESSPAGGGSTPAAGAAAGPPPAAVTPPEPQPAAAAPAAAPPAPTPDLPAPAAVPPDVPEPAQAGLGHQSVVLASVTPAASGGHGTLQFEVPGHVQAGAGGVGAVEPAPGAGASVPGAVESVPGAFDPSTAGGLPDPSDAYPGDNASQEQIAAWMGRQAHKMGLPAELPVMAGLVESGLKNDNYGDRDSLGFFQMRTSIWNQGEYAGFPNHPELQLKWFLNEALAVRKERLAGGDASYGNDPAKWGEWVADVEQPAAEYRGRYQLHLDQAESLLKQGNAGVAGSSGGGAGAGQMVAGTFEPGGAGAAAAAGSPAAVQALAVAEKYMGTAYHWGGDTPQTGFDCSGLAEYAYSQVGIHLPRVAADQFNVGVPLTKDQLRPGDLVFFKDSTGYVHHEGIYVGNDQFLHAPHTGDVVKISSLDEPYYAQQFAGGRDVTGLAGGGVPEPSGGAPPVPVDPAAVPPAPAGAPAADPGQSGVFGALGAADTPPAPPGSTVQILPAVSDPSTGSG